MIPVTANAWEIARTLLGGGGVFVGTYLVVAAMIDRRRLGGEDGITDRTRTLLWGRFLADGMSLVAQLCLFWTGVVAMDTPAVSTQVVHFTAPSSVLFGQAALSVVSAALLVSSLGRAWLRRRLRP